MRRTLTMRFASAPNKPVIRAARVHAVTIFTAFGSAVIATNAASAQNVDRAPGATMANPGAQTTAPAPGGINKYLTGKECEGLGGKVVKVQNCKSGESCYRADQDGVIHGSCITK